MAGDVGEMVPREPPARQSKGALRLAVPHQRVAIVPLS